MPIPAAKGRQILVGARIWRKFLNPFTTVSVNLTLLAIVVSICQNELALPCGARLKNRIAKSAMSENMANSQNCPDEKFEKLYKTWANGGAGLVMTGNVMIDASALGETNNVVIEKGHECLEALSAWAKAGTANNTHLWMQINHPGKQSPRNLSRVPVAPSAVGYSGSLGRLFNKPRELTEGEIVELIERFGTTARIAKEAGFTGVQIHGAHGYLVSQFLSPNHNVRTDKWGGSFENRLRFISEVYKNIRHKVGPAFPVGIKINSADFQKGGFSEEDSIKTALHLSQLGIDLLEISGGTYENPKMMGAVKSKSAVEREAYFLEYCKKIRSVVTTPLLLTGGFRTPAGIEAALNSGACDIVGLARVLALNPYFPNEIFVGKAPANQVHQLTTGIKFLDKLVPLEIVWYTEQLHRMGRGEAPKAHASVRLSALKFLGGFTWGFS